MSSCVNEKCDNHWDTLEKVCVNIDGDFACCPKCAEEYRKQRDYFFTVVIHDDDKYNQWMEGET